MTESTQLIKSLDWPKDLIITTIRSDIRELDTVECQRLLWKSGKFSRNDTDSLKIEKTDVTVKRIDLSWMIDENLGLRHFINNNQDNSIGETEIYKILFEE